MVVVELTVSIVRLRATHHHLLDHASGLTVKITELAVLWHNLLGVDLRVMGQDVGPPLVGRDVSTGCK